MYRIVFEPGDRTILVTLGGMMSVAEVGEYIAELRRSFIAHRFRPGYAILIDVRDCTIQSQTMIEAMRDHMGGFPKAAAIAMIAGSELARMQIRRLMTQPYVALFDTCADGRAWLQARMREAAA